jgi:hypothetical protein
MVLPREWWWFLERWWPCSPFYLSSKLQMRWPDTSILVHSMVKEGIPVVRNFPECKCNVTIFRIVGLRKFLLYWSYELHYSCITVNQLSLSRTNSLCSNALAELSLICDRYVSLIVLWKRSFFIIIHATQR